MPTNKNDKSSIETELGWSLFMKMLLAALILTFLMGCSKPSVVSDALVVPCDRPKLTGDTWRDVALWGLAQEEALADCADRIDLIRDAVR